MRRVFIDTAHMLAILVPADRLHAVAMKVSSEIARDPSTQFVTTHLVFAELLAGLARGGPSVRRRAAEYAAALASNDATAVVPLTQNLFERALELYASRLDKRYSLTDCVSMILCRDLDITDVLTSDRDFEQEGFVRLLDARA